MIDRENAVARLSPSKKHAFVSVFNILALGAASLALAKFVSVFFILSFLLLLGVAGYRFLYIVFIEYVITGETISTTTGIVARRVDITELYRVKDYVVKQSVFQRLFGLMTVTLITSDITHPELNLMGIPKSNIVEIVRTLVQEARRRNRVFETN